MNSSTTCRLQHCLERIRAGDMTARGDLLRHSQDRLRVLVQRMLAKYPNVRRWEDTDDVLQEVMLKVARMFGRLEIESVQDYLRLAAINIRRVLIDLARHYDGLLGLGANHASPAPDRRNGLNDRAPPEPVGSDCPQELAIWAEFHERAETLPRDQADVFDLLWYHELTQDEAAGILKISLSTLKRRWQAARIQLMEALGGEATF